MNVVILENVIWWKDPGSLEGIAPCALVWVETGISTTIPFCVVSKLFPKSYDDAQSDVLSRHEVACSAQCPVNCRVRCPIQIFFYIKLKINSWTGNLLPRKLGHATTGHDFVRRDSE